MSIRMVIVLIITLYTSRVILGVLGVEDYGVYNVVAGFVTMFGFFNSSLSNGIQRFYNFELGKNGVEGARRVYNMALLIQVLLALIIVLPTEIFGLWYLHNKMVIPEGRMFAAEWIFQLSLLTFVLHIIQVPYTAAVMAHERMDFYAIVSIFNVLISLAAVFLIPHLGGDALILYGALTALIALITLVLYIGYAKKNFKEIVIEKAFRLSLFKEMLSFSGWNIFGTLGQMMKDQGVNLILNFFFGPIVNAARGIANQVNGGLQSFVANITVPVRPQVVQSYATGDINRSLSLTYTISKLSCYFLLLMALPIMLEIDFVLKIWLGDNVPEHTSIFVVIIVLNSFINNLNAAVSGIVHASGKMKIYQLCGGSISLVSVAIVYIAMLIWDIPSIALIVLLALDIIRQFVALLVLKSIVNEFSLKVYIHDVVVPLVLVASVSLIFPMLVYNYMQMGVLRFFVVFVVSILSVASCVYMTGLNNSEKFLVKQIFNKITNRIKHK
jgi:O-antigen/teichoic acid export membrane protein